MSTRSRPKGVAYRDWHGIVLPPLALPLLPLGWMREGAAAEARDRRQRNADREAREREEEQAWRDYDQAEAEQYDDT